MRLRSAYDREILRLALPALGALAAEPLYILVDTAIVGHLGRSELAALGAAATALAVLATFNFLQYGTTAQVARATGAGEDTIARKLGAQALWLSLAIGVIFAATIAVLATPIVSLVGVEGQTADYAATYLRIVSIGIPSFFLALGGQGYLRGVAELRSPLVLIVLGNVLNVVLEVLFVYGFDWGIEGSAWGTAVAQSCMGAGFVWLIARRVGPGRSRAGALARRAADLGRQVPLRSHRVADRLRSCSPEPWSHDSATPRSARTRSRFSSGSSSRSCSTRSRSRGRSSSAASSAQGAPSVRSTPVSG